MSRTRRLDIRLTAEEKATLARRAREAGVSVSALVRSAALGLELRHRYDRLAARQLRRIGVLLNQAVRHMHRGDFSADTHAAFTRSLHALRQELEP